MKRTNYYKFLDIVFNEFFLAKVYLKKVWKKYSKYFLNILAIILLLGFFITAIALAGRLNIDIDEAATLDTTGSSFSYMLKQALNYEAQAPLYFILLFIWRQINSSIIFARIFSVLCIVGTIFISFSISKRYIHNLKNGYFTILLVTNPLLLWAAVEVRGYALVLLETSIMLVLFYDEFINRKTKVGLKRVAFICVAVAGVYTHYYIGFLIISFIVVIVARRKENETRSFFVSILIIGVACLPLAIFLPSQIHTHYATVVNHSKIYDIIKAVYVRVENYIIYIKDWPQWIRYILRIILVLLVTKSLISFLLAKKININKSTIEMMVLLIIIVVINIIFIALLMLFLHRDLVNSKHTIYMIIPLICLVVLILSLNVFDKSIKVIKIAILLVALTNILYIANRYRIPSKHGDSARIASFLHLEEDLGEPILIFPPYLAVTLMYYYEGKNVIVTVPNYLPFKKFDPSKNAITDESEIDEALKSTNSFHNSIWYISDETNEYLDVDIKKDIMEKYLYKNYKLLRATEFYGAEVRHYKKRNISKCHKY